MVYFKDGDAEGQGAKFDVTECIVERWLTGSERGGSSGSALEKKEKVDVAQMIYLKN